MSRVYRTGILLLSALAILLTSCVVVPSRTVETVNGTPVPAQIKKVLGSFYPIEGTQFQLASISTEQDERGGRSYDFSQLFSYGRSDYAVYNYVFLDVEAESVHALLPDNKSVILSIQGYPVPKSGEVEKVPTAWWLYTIVRTDTNKDEQLSHLDGKTLAISDVGGNGYTEIVTDVEQVLGDVFKDGNVLLLIYRANQKNYLAHVDLLARKVTKTSELPSFGEDVK